MFMKIPQILAFFFTCVFCFSSQAQKIDFDKYEYILIPITFGYMLEENEHQVSSLTRFLFKQEGFEVYMTEETLPFDLVENPCKALKVSLEKENLVLKIGMVLKLIDCYGKVVYQTPRVSSSLKESKPAHQEVVRKAFAYIEEMGFERALMGQTNKKVFEAPEILTYEEEQARKVQRLLNDGEIYVHERDSILVYKVENEIEIHEANAKNLITRLSKISKSTYLYNHKDFNGILTFLDEEDTLEIIYMNSETNSEVKKVYTKK